MSKVTEVEYLVYKGEKPNGTVVIKSEKPGTSLRIFSYTKGKKYRIGSDVHPRQVQFLTRNHRDLFRVEKVQVKGTELIQSDLESVIPRFLTEVGEDKVKAFRFASEACMFLLGISFDKNDPLSSFEALVVNAIQTYKDDLTVEKMSQILEREVTFLHKMEDSPKAKIDQDESEEKFSKSSTEKKVLRRRK